MAKEIVLLSGLITGLSAVIALVMAGLGIYDEAARVAMPALAVISLMIGIGFALRERARVAV